MECSVIRVNDDQGDMVKWGLNLALVDEEIQTFHRCSGLEEVWWVKVTSDTTCVSV